MLKFCSFTGLSGLVMVIYLSLSLYDNTDTINSIHHLVVLRDYYTITFMSKIKKKLMTIPNHVPNQIVAAMINKS